MALLAVGGWVVFAALLVLSQVGPFSAAPSIRPMARWIFSGTLLVCTSAFIGATSSNYHWLRSHYAVDGVEAVIIVAALTCYGVGYVKMRRHSQIPGS